MHRDHLNHRWTFRLLLLAIVGTPYYIVAHYLLGQPTIAGKSVFLAGWTAAIVSVWLWHSRIIVGRLGGLALWMLWLSALGVLGLRFLVYDGVLDLFGFRFVFVAFVYGCVALPFIRSPRDASTIRRALVWSCVIQAVLGIVHHYTFPNIVTGMALDDSGQGIYYLPEGQGGFRENGTLISANTYGAFLVLGLILLFAETSRLRLRPLALAGLMWWAIGLSGSRYALAGAALATLYFLFVSAPGWVLPILVPAAGVLLLTSPAAARVQQRFETEGSGGRVAIAALAVEVVTQSYAGLLIGVRGEEATTARTETGQILSDNSFASIAFDYGVPLALVLLGYLALVWSSLVRMRGWVLVAALFITGQFAVTNALYWDTFLLYAGTTLLAVNTVTVVGRRGPLDRQSRRRAFRSP